MGKLQINCTGLQGTETECVAPLIILSANSLRSRGGGEEDGNLGQYKGKKTRKRTQISSRNEDLQL